MMSDEKEQGPGEAEAAALSGHSIPWETLIVAAGWYSRRPTQTVEALLNVWHGAPDGFYVGVPEKNEGDRVEFCLPLRLASEAERLAEIVLKAIPDCEQVLVNCRSSVRHNNEGETQ